MKINEIFRLIDREGYAGSGLFSPWLMKAAFNMPEISTRQN